MVQVNLRPRLDQAETRQKIMKRLGIQREYMLQQYIRIHAIFILNDPIHWEDCIQIICDLCSSSNGKIVKRTCQKPIITHIPIFTVNNDLTYADEFPIPRLAYGPFTIALRSIF